MSYRVSVRALCEFAAKRGDLDLRFTPSPTALEGIEGHALVTARRDAGYQREITLGADYADLQVRGRADGYDPALNRLEEIKTYRGDLSRQPDNHRQLHWAQARTYGWLLCAERGLAEIELALVYLDIASERETLVIERHDAQTLRQAFEALCAAFLDWARSEARHRQQREAMLADLAFPLTFREGQRSLAEAVYKAAATGCHLLAQAPTGIGKTLGTLFPQLKAMPRAGLDKLFYLSAKGSGRGLALDALQRLAHADGRPLRSLELIARDKACLHPDKACHGESCPLARGFYDRLPAARAAALATPAQLDRQRLERLAHEHQVCPYYLSQELVRWVDVVVGDYNYFFDTSALLHALTQSEGWRVTVLVDEAHNLVERAREMYSAELDQSALAGLRKLAPKPLQRSLSRLQTCWKTLNEEAPADYRVLREAPRALLAALSQAVAVCGEWLSEPGVVAPAELLTWYFEVLHFTRLAESHSADHSLFDLSRRPAPRGRHYTRLGLRNLLPASFLAPRFASARSVALFSATLAPAHYQRDLLGLPAHTPWLDVQSPFHGTQLQVRIASDLSTRFADRRASLAPIARLLGEQYASRPGNYLAFFSSFEYLQQVLQQFTQAYPQIPQWSQARGMREAEREAFLARFEAGGRGIGFAVLGGAFGEGIDLPGERLIGAFVATLGLPQLNPLNEQRRACLQRRFGRGYDYAYLYPGLQKVVQAAGRVIRSEQDRGALWLIDDRFARTEVLHLLPDWWQPQVCQVAAPAASSTCSASTSPSTL